MGHIRLGQIPKTRPWRAVVSAVIEPSFAEAAPEPEGTSLDAQLAQPIAQAHVAEIASRALHAAEVGLNKAIDDRGLRYTFFLLTQIALASRKTDWTAQLKQAGILLRDSSTAFDLTSELHAAVDRYLLASGSSTDVSEIAQRSAGEALSKLAVDRAQTLFGNSGEDLRLALRQLSTKAGFSELGQAFFGRFLTHFLNFYLSRITAAEIGSPGVRSLSAITRFNDALALHCEQSAAIVRDFAGEWYSKTEYERGIDPDSVAGFVAVAIRKIQSELRTQHGSK